MFKECMGVGPIAGLSSHWLSQFWLHLCDNLRPRPLAGVVGSGGREAANVDKAVLSDPS
jgi:hypothetical protein